MSLGTSRVKQYTGADFRGLRTIVLSRYTIPQRRKTCFSLRLHPKAGRYTLALESLDKGVTMWRELGGANESGLETVDEVRFTPAGCTNKQCTATRLRRLPHI